MDLKKLSALQTRLHLALLDARNVELNDLPDSEQIIYLSAVLTDLIGALYAMFTISYDEDLDTAIGLATSELRKSNVEQYKHIKKIQKSVLTEGS